MARPKALDSLSISDLQSLISDRKKKVGELKRDRRKLRTALAKIEKQLSRVGVAGGRKGAGRIRPENAKPLVEVIYSVLKDAKGPIRVPEIADRVQASGYRSSSDRFTAIVNQTLIKDKKFKAASRGHYTLA